MNKRENKSRGTEARQKTYGPGKRWSWPKPDWWQRK